jgi:hypothetical protein
MQEWYEVENRCKILIRIVIRIPFHFNDSIYVGIYDQ